MPPTFISLKEASTLSGKSIQTIRRAVKSKKIKSKRQRTPQGYNYVVSQISIIDFYKLRKKLFDRKHEGLNDDLGNRLDSQMTSQQSRKRSKKLFVFSEKKYLTPQDLEQFNQTFKEFVRQSQREREEFLCLVKAFQEKIIVLENQMKLLETSNQKRWYQFWR